MIECVAVLNKESLTECCTRSFRNARIGYAALAGGIVTVIVALAIDGTWGAGTMTFVTLWLLCLVGIALTCWTFYTSAKMAYARSVAKMVAEIKCDYGTPSVELKTVVDRDRVEVVRSDGAVATLLLADLEGWHETDRYFVLSFMDATLLPIDKFRVGGGSLDELRAHINSYIC